MTALKRKCMRSTCLTQSRRPTISEEYRIRCVYTSKTCFRKTVLLRSTTQVASQPAPEGRTNEIQICTIPNHRLPSFPHVYKIISSQEKPANDNPSLPRSSHSAHLIRGHKISDSSVLRFFFHKSVAGGGYGTARHCTFWLCHHCCL